MRMVTNQTSHLTKELFWDGLQDFEYAPIFRDLIKEMDVFFDIGASIGLYSLMASQLNPDIVVHAFEPSHGPNHFLMKNIALNAPNHIHAHKLALSSSNGHIDFFADFNPKYGYLPYHLGGTGNIENTHALASAKKHRVPTQTLDDFVEQHNIERIDLMKVDTEATEHYILRGGANTIHRFQPIIICELLYNKIEEKLEAIMGGHGYLFYKHTPQGLVLAKTLRRDEDDGVENVFFVPRSKKHIIEPFVSA